MTNFMPREMHDLCAKYLAGDVKEASDMQVKLTGLINALFADVNPIPVKEAMNMLGMNVGPCRLPLYETSDAVKVELKRTLLENGFKL